MYTQKSVSLTLSFVKLLNICLKSPIYKHLDQVGKSKVLNIVLKPYSHKHFQRLESLGVFENCICQNSKITFFSDFKKLQHLNYYYKPVFTVGKISMPGGSKLLARFF